MAQRFRRQSISRPRVSSRRKIRRWKRSSSTGGSSAKPSFIVRERVYRRIPKRTIALAATVLAALDKRSPLQENRTCVLFGDVRTVCGVVENDERFWNVERDGR